MEKFHNKGNVLITSIVETVSNFVTNHASNCTVIHGSIYYISKSKQLSYDIIDYIFIECYASRPVNPKNGGCKIPAGNAENVNHFVIT